MRAHELVEVVSTSTSNMSHRTSRQGTTPAARGSTSSQELSPPSLVIRLQYDLGSHVRGTLSNSIRLPCPAPGYPQ